jgi:hypothetical protein
VLVFFPNIWTLPHLQMTYSLSSCCAFSLPSYSVAYLVFSGFTSRPTSLLASNRACVFSALYSIYVLSHYINIMKARSWCVLFNFRPSWFSLVQSEGKNRSSVALYFYTPLRGAVLVSVLAKWIGVRDQPQYISSAAQTVVVTEHVL